MNTNGVTIVSDHKELKEFIEVPYRMYTQETHWVPPLRSEQKKLLDTVKNPFFRNAEQALFIAERNGETAGRISAVVDRRYNDFYGTKTGHFGFFECVDSQETANLLFKVACDWLKERGMTDVLGPASPGMMDTIGLLVEGFDRDPYIMMPYNKPYYEKLVLNAGFENAMEMYAYVVDQEHVTSERMDRAIEIVYKRNPGLVIRRVNLKKIHKEVEIVREIFNIAWRNNWGFIPLTKEELEMTANDFKLILDPDFAHIAEVDGKPVAFSVALPDLNQVFKKMNGSLFPTGIFKLLFGRKKINRVRTALMGVLPEFHGKGIDALLHQKAIENGLKRNFVESELSWILSTNTDMIRVAERIGGRRDKTYRMYSKQL